MEGRAFFVFREAMPGCVALRIGFGSDRAKSRVVRISALAWRPTSLGQPEPDVVAASAIALWGMRILSSRTGGVRTLSGHPDPTVHTIKRRIRLPPKFVTPDQFRGPAFCLVRCAWEKKRDPGSGPE